MSNSIKFKNGSEIIGIGTRKTENIRCKRAEKYVLLDDYIDEWHESDSELEIYEFLDMTQEEYRRWVRNNNEKILNIYELHKRLIETRKYIRFNN